MKLQINGKNRELPDGTSLLSFLEEEQYQPGTYAIELNLEIIPKENYSDIILKENDVLEIVTFMGGGAASF